MTVASAIAALAGALVLGWTGAGKLFDAGQPPAALTAALGGRDCALTVLRLLAAVELAVAVGLVAWPALPPGLVASLLGAGFLCYLTYARRAAPGSSCGCAGQDTPIGWRSYLRAGWLVLAGVLAAAGTVPWWWTLAAHPGLVPCGLAAALAVAVACSAELDRAWLLPARQYWLRLRGHPFAGSDGVVPVAASVELVESSLAWQAAAHLVRSSLIEYWVADGWRVLRYTGVHEDGDGARPVSVLFAVDALARVEEHVDPVVRLSMVDLATQEVVETNPTKFAART